jgi:hypothetical protein
MLPQKRGTETITEGNCEVFGSGATPMASKFIDLTLPAHDPNSPKPRALARAA